MKVVVAREERERKAKDKKAMTASYEGPGLQPIPSHIG